MSYRQTTVSTGASPHKNTTIKTYEQLQIGTFLKARNVNEVLVCRGNASSSFPLGVGTMSYDLFAIPCVQPCLKNKDII